MLGAYAAFTLMDASIKILAGQYHVVQVVFFNALFALVTVTLVGGIRRRLARVRSPQWRLHLLRWAIGLLVGINLLTTGIALAAVAMGARRMGRADARPTAP